jgi:alpha-L-fucosidase 2
LAGSPDGLTWNVVDSRSDERFADARQTRTFDVAGSSAYSAYRLTVRGRSPSGKLAIAGIAIAGAGLDTADSKIIADYRRALDPAVGLQHSSYVRGGHRILREAFVSKDADCLILRYRTDDPAGLTGTVSLAPGQDGAQVVASDNGIGFEGTMANNLRFAAAYGSGAVAAEWPRAASTAART